MGRAVLFVVTMLSTGPALPPIRSIDERSAPARVQSTPIDTAQIGGANPAAFEKGALDSDGDTLPDEWEIDNNLDPNDATGVNGADGDPDGDRLVNSIEFESSTDPNDFDTDGDGVDDHFEVIVPGLDPNNTDSDGDGLSDGFEVFDPRVSATDSDTDDDGLSDGDEINVFGTDPTEPDTDEDGLNDGEEIANGTNPFLSDTDGDGLRDRDELFTFNTDPTRPDTDGDGLSDVEELFTTATDPVVSDTDGDGLNDGAEVAAATDPLNPESGFQDVYVSQGGSDSTGTGLIEAPWRSINHAISAVEGNAGHIMTIHVEEGTYLESLVLQSYEHILGGYEIYGGETTGWRRDPDLFVSFVQNSASGGGSIPQFVNQRMVLMNQTVETLFDGFTIRFGNFVFDGSFSGGGIAINEADATNVVSNCVIRDNIGDNAGGILFSGGSTAIVRDCKILENDARVDVGGILVFESSPSIIDCIISGNRAPRRSGGVGVISEAGPNTVTFINCVISGNEAENAGGVGVGIGALAVLVNCIVSGNTATVRSGGFGAEQSDTVLLNCTIDGNAATEGGGLVVLDTATATVVNTIVSHNTGVGLFEVDASADFTLAHSLLFDNGSGNFFDEGASTFVGAADINEQIAEAANNVDGDPSFFPALTGLWANGTFDFVTSNTTLTAESTPFVPDALEDLLVRLDPESVLQSVILSNTSDTIVVPGFHFADEEWAGKTFEILDYHLRDDSAAIGRGALAFDELEAPSTDFEGEVRPGADGFIDIGADETNFTPPKVLSIVRTAQETVNAPFVSFRVTFDEAVTGLDFAGPFSDFRVNAPALSEASVNNVVEQSPTEYEVTVATGTGDGPLRIDVADSDTIIDMDGVPLGGTGVGNGDFTAGEAYLIDRTPPTLSLFEPLEARTNTGPIDFRVVYEGATAVTLTLDDVDVSTTGTASGEAAVSGEGIDSFLVSIGALAGDGTLRISIRPGTAQDEAGNEAPGAGPSQPIVIDNTRPRIFVGPPSTTVTGNGPVSYVVTYEDADVVTLFEDDILPDAQGTAAATFRIEAIDDASRRVVLENVSGDGALAFAISEGTAVDDAGNAARGVTAIIPVTVDNTPPVITLLGDNPAQVTVGNPYEDAGATAEDNLDGDITDSLRFFGVVDTAQPGPQSVTYTVEDSAANGALATRIVLIVEEVAIEGGGEGSGEIEGEGEGGGDNQNPAVTFGCAAPAHRDRSAPTRATNAQGGLAILFAFAGLWFLRRPQKRNT